MGSGLGLSISVLVYGPPLKGLGHRLVPGPPDDFEPWSSLLWKEGGVQGLVTLIRRHDAG